ncbi:precorrin-6Y C5,15-methyltransferase (decarboxylating) subunit CbiT [Tessaracoccus sp. HDW20]|uniref:bifunctional cobalt-precorrin-7 (C(5))-methyltransferase/cobalt-precorrin-6B (C(15))-methyltransferase n=1 Tax=Tessaracoccus coleopterorum TaxID=2714950 RepID=UPI0018D3AC93|nr:precorrin-6Y C5,15-methyltransferase (decarboxylating) subunit CbiT [Tessaracoccus coleopterorum]
MIVDRDAALLGRMPGLPDEVFASDGLITKRVIRASALAHLRPLPGQLLWDVGTGAGSIAVEWCRAAEGLAPSASNVGPTGRRGPSATPSVSPAKEPSGLSRGRRRGAGRSARPDAVFVGGGGTLEVLELAMAALRDGGRLVVHGITVEAEQLCVAAHERWGGHLSRIQVENVEPLGSLLGWKPLRTVTQWAVAKA